MLHCEQVLISEHLFTGGTNIAVSQEQYRLLYRIAHAYYDEGLTQEQIARRFGLSRPKVSRLLQQARQEKVVSIVITPPPGDGAGLEHALEQRYGLEEAIVVTPNDATQIRATIRELGPAAAECLLRSIPEKGIVGIAWGSTLLAVVDALPSRAMPDVTVVQVVGGLGPVDSREHSTELTRRVAHKLGAQFRLLPAPGVVSSRAAAEALRADGQIAATLALAAGADVAVVGLGAPSPGALLLRDGSIISAPEMQAIIAAGAVGDLALRYLKADGQPLDLEINDRIIGLTLEQLRRIPRVIGVAGGESKIAILRAALRARLLHVLVTDQASAARLLEEESDD